MNCSRTFDAPTITITINAGDNVVVSIQPHVSPLNVAITNLRVLSIGKNTKIWFCPRRERQVIDRFRYYMTCLIMISLTRRRRSNSELQYFSMNDRNELKGEF